MKYYIKQTKSDRFEVWNCELDICVTETIHYHLVTNDVILDNDLTTYNGALLFISKLVDYDTKQEEIFKKESIYPIEFKPTLEEVENAKISEVIFIETSIPTVQDSEIRFKDLIWPLVFAIMLGVIFLAATSRLTN